MARAPILAAGGIVVRGGARPLIAVVQRRKDNGWVLPKGKLKPKERALTAARREVREETGQNVKVREFLGVMSCSAGGRLKVVQFWKMEAVNGPPGKLMRDIKAVEWLPLSSAIKRLSFADERAFLHHVRREAVKLGEHSRRKPQRTVRPDRSTRKRPAAAPRQRPARPTSAQLSRFRQIMAFLWNEPSVAVAPSMLP
jgi:8-oxo-dGTP diphosphatase